MKFEERRPGLFVVTYRAGADLAPELQAPLVDALKPGASVVFDVGAEVNTVDLAVPTFWLGVTSRVRLERVAIVTTRTMVRVAASGFSLANVARRLPTKVSVFESLREAITWCSTTV